MPVNVIGLLNIAIDKDEYAINEYLSLVNRDYIEKNNISMPADIRFYKTFIVSTADISPDFNLDKISDNKREQIPVFFLWVMSMVMLDFDITHSEWFMGDSYATLKETIKVCLNNISKTSGSIAIWANSFKIENNVNNLSEEDIARLIDIYNQVIQTYKEQIKTPDNVNLHWLYAFTKFQECCKSPASRQCVVHVTSALEFILVNTSEESSFRAAFFSALICEKEYEERMSIYEFLKWAFGTRERISAAISFSGRNLIDKSDLPENMLKLKSILAKVLVATLGLTNKEIQERINKMMFNVSEF
ncbi:MAG: hypothetical protein ACM3UU_00670 [Ignavibacteriales bacterium]